MAELMWMTEKPTVPGIYWWRGNESHADSIVVKVYTQDNCSDPGRTDE